jgi:hypothetical protein
MLPTSGRDRTCLPQYFGPKNTGEDCELAGKKKNDNRVLHDLLLSRGVDVRAAQTSQEFRRAGLDQSGVQWRMKKPQPQTDYANHGQNLDKNIFMICHEITYRKSSCVVQ